MAKNKDAKAEKPPASSAAASPAPKSEAKPEASKPTYYSGDSIQKKLLWVGIILMVSGFFLRLEKQNNIPEYSGLKFCHGLADKNLSAHVPSVRQVIRPDCFSIISMDKSTAGRRVSWKVPGQADICFFRSGKCAVLERSGIGDIIRKETGEVPEDYTALLFRGDPGEVQVALN